MSAIDDVRELIDRRLRSVQLDIERLRNALAALEATPRTPHEPPHQPRARPRARRRRAPRGSVRQAVVDALSAGSARTAGEIAAAAEMNPATLSSILPRMVSDGTIRKAARGYEIPAPTLPALDANNPRADPILDGMRADLRAGLRTSSGN